MPSAAGVPITGAGGYVVAYDGSAYCILDNAQYSISAPGITDDVTTSAVAGNGTRVLMKKLRLSVTISLPEDDPSSIEASGGIAAGTQYTLYCRRGGTSASTKFDIVDNCTFTGFNKDNDTAGGTARRVTATFEGGGYTGYQTAPAGLATYLSSVTRS